MYVAQQADCVSLRPEVHVSFLVQQWQVSGPIKRRLSQLRVTHLRRGVRTG